MSSLNNLKIAITSYEGRASICGPEKPVVYVAEQECLIIKQLTFDESVQILKILEGGLLTGADAEAPAKTIVTSTNAKPAAAPAAKPTAPATTKTPAKPAPAPVAKAKPAPAPEPEPEPEPDADADVDVDDVLADEDAPTVDFDMEFLSTQTKLRPVLEHIHAKGFTTVEGIVEQATAIREHVPALTNLDNFDKRIGRAVEVVLEGLKK